MFHKLLVFVFLLVPVMASGQDNSSPSSTNRELIFNGLTVSGKVGDIDRFFSAEFRWGVNDELNVVVGSGKDKKPTLRFVPGIELEYLEDTARSESTLVKRYSRLLWLKGYLTFRQEKKLRPYVGGAMGLDNETIEFQNNPSANKYETVAFVNSFGLTADLLAGVHFYPHNRIVLTASTKLWRPSLNFGAGFTF